MENSIFTIFTFTMDKPHNHHKIMFNPAVGQTKNMMIVDVQAVVETVFESNAGALERGIKRRAREMCDPKSSEAVKV